MSVTEHWLANHRETGLWSGPDDGAIQFARVSQWSVFKQLKDQQGPRIYVHFFGNSVSPAGDVYVDAADLGPIDKPHEPIREPDPDGGDDHDPIHTEFGTAPPELSAAIRAHFTPDHCVNAARIAYL